MTGMCNECAARSGQPRAFVGVAPRNFWAQVTCDRCGPIYVDHTGDRQQNVQTSNHPKEAPMYNEVQPAPVPPQATARVYPPDTASGYSPAPPSSATRQQEFQRLLDASVEQQLRPTAELVNKIVSRIQEIESYVTSLSPGTSDGLQPRERLMLTLYERGVITRPEIRAAFGLPDDTPLGRVVSPVSYSPAAPAPVPKKRGRPRKAQPPEGKPLIEVLRDSDPPVELPAL